MTTFRNEPITSPSTATSTYRAAIVPPRRSAGDGGTVPAGGDGAWPSPPQAQLPFVEHSAIVAWIDLTTALLFALLYT